MPQGWLHRDPVLVAHLVAVPAGPHIWWLAPLGPTGRSGPPGLALPRTPRGTRTQFLLSHQTLLLTKAHLKWRLCQEAPCPSSRMGGLGLSGGFERLEAH